MRQDNIEFAASHSVVMVTNHKPTVGGDDPAQWRRLRIVPFDVVVANPNKRLKEQLAVELPAVLAWLVAGYREWHHHGLDEPEVVVNATDAYRASSDALGRFLDERCILSRAATVKARKAFGAWSSWCHQNGEDVGTEKALADSLLNCGFEKERSNGMVYVGLGLAAEDDQSRDLGRVRKGSTFPCGGADLWGHVTTLPTLPRSLRGEGPTPSDLGLF